MLWKPEPERFRRVARLRGNTGCGRLFVLCGSQGMQNLLDTVDGHADTIAWPPVLLGGTFTSPGGRWERKVKEPLGIANGSSSYGRARDHLLFEFALYNFVLLLRLLLVRAKHKLRIRRQRLEENIQPFTVLMFEGNAYI
jgi:hypothetical protein